jgi:hypothetical protein
MEFGLLQQTLSFRVAAAQHIGRWLRHVAGLLLIVLRAPMDGSTP